MARLYTDAEFYTPRIVMRRVLDAFPVKEWPLFSMRLGYFPCLRLANALIAGKRLRRNFMGEPRVADGLRLARLKCYEASGSRLPVTCVYVHDIPAFLRRVSAHAKVDTELLKRLTECSKHTLPIESAVPAEDDQESSMELSSDDEPSTNLRKKQRLRETAQTIKSRLQAHLERIDRIEACILNKLHDSDVDEVHGVELIKAGDRALVQAISLLHDLQ